jgi:hypothetical protein
MIPRGAARELLGVPALNWDSIDVAEQIERDPASVGAHVDAHPRSFTGLKLERSVETEALVHVPFIG